MANTNVTTIDAACVATNSVLDENEIQIMIRPRDGFFWRGSRAQLIAERLIPPGFQWPDRPDQWREWSDSTFSYSMLWFCRH